MPMPKPRSSDLSATNDYKHFACLDLPANNVDGQIRALESTLWS